MMIALLVLTEKKLIVLIVLTKGINFTLREDVIILVFVLKNIFISKSFVILVMRTVTNVLILIHIIVSNVLNFLKKSIFYKIHVMKNVLKVFMLKKRVKNVKVNLIYY
jgi:hypothetical protein